MSATQTPEISSKDKGNETEDPHHTDASAETSQQAESKEDPSKTPSNTLTPASQPVRLTRKRAASLMARGETRHPEPLSLTSAPIPPRIGDSASQVCLCQPEPKVRRPRNGLFHRVFIFLLPTARRAAITIDSGILCHRVVRLLTACYFLYSIYPLSPTLPGLRRGAKSWSCKPGNLKDNRRAVETTAPRN